MSSSLAYDPGAAKRVVAAAGPKLGPGQADSMGRMMRLGLSPRQQRLNLLWARYCAQQYEARKWDWTGREVLAPLDREAVASGSAIPPGFVDQGGQMVPLQFRKPTAPYHLARVIVNRFTGLLFSKRHHPQVRIEGDPDTEDYIRILAEVSRLWPKFMEARRFGGGTGTAVVGFQFVNGRPRVEVHDPRWCTPDFVDREQLILRSVDKRYMYPEEQKDPETGAIVEVPYWYRRVITQTTDTVFKPVPVGDGEEPVWVPDTEVAHNLGFCPVVWIQNEPVSDDVDGAPDCEGVFDMLDTIDALLAQANLGTLANCDPTLLIKTNKLLAEIRKGSDNAIKLPAGENGGDAKYLEITGSGPKAARELAAELRSYALEVAQCVLDQPGQQAAVTATEIERRYSAMIERADMFREQYGERGVKPLLAMMVKAARKLQDPHLVNGQAVTEVLDLPPRVVPDPNNPKNVQRFPRKLGNGGEINLQWPDYFTPSSDDATKKVTAATTARTGKLVDAEHAARYVADVFGVEDVHPMLRKIEQEAQDQQAELERLAMSGVTGAALGQVSKTGVGRDDDGAAPEDGGQPGNQGGQQPPPHPAGPLRQKPQQQDGGEE